MIDMTVQKVAAAVGGQLHGSGGERAVLGAVRDNREVQPGLMFCALPGARRDGHEFIEAALASGAPCCLAQRVPEGATGPVVTVPDVAKAMARLAEHCRGQVKAPVVGITGSSGKTTAKEMCARVLSRRFNTLKTEKNFNNELGVPLTIFRIMPETEAAVVELGISDFGEMSRLGAMARPDIAVYTLIGRSHLEALGDGFFTPMFEKLVGAGWVREMIRAGATDAEIRARWLPEAEQFRTLRAKYLLYEE